MKKNRLLVGIMLTVCAILFSIQDSNAQIFNVTTVTQIRNTSADLNTALRVFDSAGQGTKGQAALRVNMAITTTAGSGASPTFSRFTFNYEGTDINDVENFRLNFASYAPNTQDFNIVNSAFVVSITNVSISGSTVQFTTNFTNNVNGGAGSVTGNAGIMLYYDIKQNATIGNTIRFSLLDFVYSGVTYTNSAPLPAGLTTILGNMSGTYTVNNALPVSSTNYTSVGTAFIDLNNRGVGAGGVEFIFEDGQRFNNIDFFENWMRVTGAIDRPVLIRRSYTGSTPPTIVQIQGNNRGGDAFLKLDAVSFYTIVGINFENRIGILNNSLSHGIIAWSYPHLSCNNILIKDCYLNGFNTLKNTNDIELSSTDNAAGIHFRALNAAQSLPANNIVILNNTLSGFRSGIRINNATGATRGTGNMILGNSVSNFSVTGIELINDQNAVVANNYVHSSVINGAVPNSTQLNGIRVTGIRGTSRVYNNKVNSLYYLTSGLNIQVNGLFVEGTLAGNQSFIFNNEVAELNAPNSLSPSAAAGSNNSYYAVRGIQLGGNTSNNLYRVFNNSINLKNSSSTALFYTASTGGGHQIIATNNLMSTEVTVASLAGTLFANNNSGNSPAGASYLTVFSSLSGNNFYNLISPISNRIAVTGGDLRAPVYTITSFSMHNLTVERNTSGFGTIPFTTDINLMLTNSVSVTGVPVTVPGLNTLYGFEDATNDFLNRDINGYRRNLTNPTLGANEAITLVSNIVVTGQGGLTTIPIYKESLQMEAAVLPANATYTDYVWSASPSNIATISGTGVLQALGIADGVVTVRATATDGSKVFGEATITVTGQVLVSSISVTGANITSYQGTSQMTATVAPANASNKNVSWMVDNTSLATISGTGELKAVGGANGIVVVSAMSLDAASVVGAAMVTVSGQIIATSVSISAPEYVLTTFGGNLQFTETVLPANAENKSVSWSVSNTSVATISGAGLLSALSNGVVTVTAMTQDGSMLSDSKVVTLSGQTRVSSISLSVNEGINVLTVKGATLTLTPTVLPADAAIKAVTWSVNAPTVATISGAGVLQSLSDGVVTVTATATDGSGVVGSLPLTITGQVLVSSISALGQGGASSITTRGGSLQINATVLPANASFRAITWSVSDISIATISGTGLLKALADGVVTVTASATDASGVVGRTAIQITNQVAVSSITVSPSTGSITTKGGVLALSAEVLPANASNNNFTWSVSNNLIATISGTGILVARADGVVTVTATALDGSGVRGTSVVTVTNQVLVTNIVIQPQGGQNTISTQGGTIQFSAVVSPGNASVRSVSWSVSDAALASVSGSGLVAALGDGVVTVTASALDASGISRAFVITITNQVLVSSISISGANGAASISEKAGTLQLEFVVSPANASDKTLNITVSDTNVVSFNENTGLITAKANGVVTITAVAADASGVSNTIVIEVTNQESATVNTGNLKGVSVYPVPNSGTFFVKTPATGTLSIFNSQGVVVYSKAVSSGENKVEGLHSGIFTVLVSSSEGSASFKIVVE